MEAKPYLKSISLDSAAKRTSYPFSIPAIAAIDNLDFHPNVTFLIGENGSGKSTLLEAIALAMGLSAQGGTRNVMMDDAGGTSGLHLHLKPKRSYQRPRDSYFLRAESFYNLATFMDGLPEFLGSYGGKSLHQQSHGESFMATLVNKFKGHGLYILDEPEAALSPTRQLAAMVRINDLVKKQSQFIIATHSPILMAFPGALIYLLDETGIRSVTYEETEHFKVTRDFLDSYPKRLKQLLTDTPLLKAFHEPHLVAGSLVSFAGTSRKGGAPCTNRKKPAMPRGKR